MTGKTTESPTLETLDKERVLHPATSIADHLRTGPRIMAEGSGVTLTDVSGRRYLDAFAGLWCVNIGYGRTEVADAMAAQARRLATTTRSRRCRTSRRSVWPTACSGWSRAA